MGACFCIGPQNGEPKCPCQMRNVSMVNGRYVTRPRDLGPVIQPLIPLKPFEGSDSCDNEDHICPKCFERKKDTFKP
jgi:hypothetical protein